MVVFAIWSVRLLGVPLWAITARTGSGSAAAGMVLQAQPVRAGVWALLMARRRHRPGRHPVHGGRGRSLGAALWYATRRLRADVAPGREPGRFACLAALGASEPVLLVAQSVARRQPRALERVASQPAHTDGEAGLHALHRRDGHGHGGRSYRRRQTWGWHRGRPARRGQFLRHELGLLLPSATAPTTLTEERVRGSLDVLLTTPLPTRVIVVSKWWAIYRRALPLVLLPALTGLFVAVASPDQPTYLPVQFLAKIHPIHPRDRLLAGILPSEFLLAHAAAATSFGLAMATWFRRTGLAVAVSVTGFVVVSIGWIIVVVAVLRPVLLWWSEPRQGAPRGDRRRGRKRPGRPQPYRRADAPSTPSTLSGIGRGTFHGCSCSWP